MIFKTINDDFTSAIDNTTTLTNKIGLFGKSLKDIKAVWDVEGWSGVKNMFSLSITDRDIEKL